MTRRRPTVFDLDEVGPDPVASLFDEADTADPAPQPRRATHRRGPEADPSEPAPEPAPIETPLPVRRTKGFSWLGLFAASLSAFTALALSLSLTAFVTDLFTRAPLLGVVAAALAALAVLGLVGMALREGLAVRRLKTVEALRRRADEAAAADSGRAARAVLADLVALYADRPTTARGRKALKAHMAEVIDGRDLIGLAERDVLGPLDKEAVRLIVGSSRRVAAVTALSPRALVDVAYVVFEALALVRRLAFLYGGRPGLLGFVRVLRQAIAQLAVTGGMAAGDSLMGEVIGNSLAAKLSARLGEGIVNGLMTARLGLAALDVLRPLPFVATRRPRVADVIAEISRIAPKDAAKGAT